MEEPRETKEQADNRVKDKLGEMLQYCATMGACDSEKSALDDIRRRYDDGVITADMACAEAERVFAHKSDYH